MQALFLAQVAAGCGPCTIKKLPHDNYGYFARALLAQELSAVTAACMLVRRSAYLEIGGFDEQNLKVAFNDVDFCLRLAQQGYRIIYTPYAEFYHHESASRGLEDNVSKHLRFSAEVKYIKETGARLSRPIRATIPTFRLAKNSSPSPSRPGCKAVAEGAIALIFRHERTYIWR